VAEQVIAGRYRLERRLGAGGTAEVWAALDLDLDREVALKVLAPQADPGRFRREAQAAAALAHPNICTLYSYGEIDGRPFIVLEYLPGGSLEDRLAGGGHLPDEETARIAREIAAGLAHAHGRGLVHRDLKPANILFDAAGRAKIADFGIARLGEEPGLTAAGTVLGTAAYISPEQAAGEPATAASDVYAFGVILFRMLTGRLPFEAGDAISLAAMHRELPVPAVAALRPDVPPRLESVATAALAKSPRDRPRDGNALLVELAEAVRPAAATAVTAVLPPARRTRPAAVVLTAAVLAAAGVALAVAVTFGHGTGDRTSSSTPATRATATAPTTAPASTAAGAPATVPPPPTSTTEATLPVSTSPASTTRPLTSAPLETQPASSTVVPTIAPPASVPPATVLPPPTVPATTEAPPPPAPPTTETFTTETTGATAVEPAPQSTTTAVPPTTSPG